MAVPPDPPETGHSPGPPPRPPLDVLLLAAGLGTRLAPLTDTMPKCLVPVAGQAPLDRWFRLLEPLPLRRVVVNTHHRPQPVRARLALYARLDGRRWEELHEPALLGTGGTLRHLLPTLPPEGDLLLLFADTISELDPVAFVADHRADGQRREGSRPASLGLFRAPDPRACGIVELDAGGLIRAFTEKPAAPRSDLASAGILLAPVALLAAHLHPGDDDLSATLLPRLAAAGRLRGVELPGYHRDMGTLDGLAAIEADRARGLWALRRPVEAPSA